MEIRDRARDYFKNLQEKITEKLSHLNKQSYQQDLWDRDGGGGGDTRVYEAGALLEKGGVNFSEVYGDFSPEFAKTLPHGNGTEFYATGISLVLHPINPFVPTVHANFRAIQRGDSLWFGGGADLTPYYPYREDAVHFHKTYKEALDPHGEELYPEFKKKCDEYFYLPHRKETRGVGGIFFDYQMGDMEQKFNMLKSCGDAFLPSYLPIVEKRLHMEFNKRHKKFQEIRRGRYVEFNLLYDRGTIFGLKTNGRVESILMSLPKNVQWHYNYQMDDFSEESKLLDYLKPQDWV